MDNVVRPADQLEALEPVPALNMRVAITRASEGAHGLRSASRARDALFVCRPRIVPDCARKGP